MKHNTLYLTGGTGFVGSAIIESWCGRGSHHRVIVQTRDLRREGGNTQVQWVRSYDDVGEPVLAVINLAGAGIADARWTVPRKRTLEASRIALTKSLIEKMRVSEFQPQVLVSASAIGFYGRGRESVDEGSSCGEGYAAALCAKWESAAQTASDFARVVLMRLGVVLGPGGMLEKLKPIYAIGLGGPIGDGRQGLPWISRADAVNAFLEAALDSRWQGPLNIVAPDTPIQSDFARHLAAVMCRPSFLPTPAFAMRLAYGEMASELLLDGHDVRPSALQCLEFNYQHPHLRPALEAALSAMR